MVVAELGVEALVALSPAGLPRVGAIAVNGAVFAFAFGVTTLAGLLVGLIPALYASRGDLVAGIQQGSRRTAGGRQWTRRALVVSEVALAIVLLVSAGFLFRSLDRLFAVAPGFDAAHLLTMQVQYNGHRYDDGRVRRRFLAQALEAARRVPGVAAAAFTSLLPLSGDQYGVYGTQFEDGNGYDVFRYVMTPGYCQTMGIALRRGRLLDEHDTAGAPPAALIGESLAKRQFPGQDPIGRRVHVGPLNRPWYTIVGVVGDVKQGSLADSQADAVYITPAQSWFADDAMSLVVRARERRDGAGPRHQERHLVGGQGSAYRPRRHHGHLLAAVGVAAALRHDRVRGVRPGGAAAGRHRHLRRSLRQRQPSACARSECGRRWARRAATSWRWWFARA
jgi:putative ABC transport system permease protein